MATRNVYELKGPVRVCRLERKLHIVRCGEEACEPEERSFVSTTEFRADGSLARQQHRNPDGSEWATIHEYNAAGLLIGVRSEDEHGGTKQQSHFEYDELGRPTRTTYDTPEGPRVAEICEYDAQGRKKKTRFIDLASQKAGTAYSYGVEGSSTSYSAPGAATMITLYNEREQPAEVQFRGVAGDLLSRVLFTYDERGHMVEEAQSSPVEALLKMVPPNVLEQMNAEQKEAMLAALGGLGGRHTYKYDEQGRKVESRMRMGELGGHTQTWSYNEHGDEVGCVMEDRQSECNFDDSGELTNKSEERTHRSEGRTSYEYDAHGNWVVKTVEGRGSDGEFRVSSVERRTLEYFA